MTFAPDVSCRYSERGPAGAGGDGAAYFARPRESGGALFGERARTEIPLSERLGLCAGRAIRFRKRRCLARYGRIAPASLAGLGCGRHGGCCNAGAASAPKEAAVAGGPPQAIAEATSGRGGAWAKRGVIIYAPDAGGPLWRVNADGTNPAPLTAKLYVAAEVTHRWPVFLPDGDHFLFWAGTFGSTTENRANGIYVSSLTALEKKLLIPARSNPGYSNGELLYVDDKRELIAVPVDAPHAKV